jgi:hypothetical protein
LRSVFTGRLQASDPSIRNAARLLELMKEVLRDPGLGVVNTDRIEFLQAVHHGGRRTLKWSHREVPACLK